ncbi:hypothetical protein LPJ61_001902 [Coemansia biformis]|uniref:TPR-like protein n=1 Tax=Coemansia biformis TaxID=1286918 RepID=A0A9W7YFJ5_9FUNG|nr:hypothetical protein LPJ61_001902 [Coemansia biformis]
MAAGPMVHTARPQGAGPFNFADMRHQLGGAQPRPMAPHADWAVDFARHQAAGAAPASHAELEQAFARSGMLPMSAGAPVLMRPAAPLPAMGQHAGWAEQFHQPAAQGLASTGLAVPAAAAAATATAMHPSPMALAFNEARMYSMMPGPGMAMPHMMPAPLMAQQQQQQQQVRGAARLHAGQPAQVEAQVRPAVDDDGLAQAAAQVLDAVRGSANPKLKSSEFMSFMQQLADGQATIAGDKVVAGDKGKQAEQHTSAAASGPTWATEFEKRAEELLDREAAAAAGEQTPWDGKIFSEEFARGLERNWAEEFEQALDGPLVETAVSGHPSDADVKLDQPSSSYAHGEASRDWLEQFKDNIEPMLSEQDREWLETQKEWEGLSTLEASYRAIDPELSVYRFQHDNRYADMAAGPLRETVRHMLENPEAASLSDTIMAMESAATQDPQDAGMWLQLGLKQQENEQEQAAIAALRKAVALEPDLTDAHLALAVSYTNEGYQQDAYDELHEWIARHDRYKALVPESAPESMSDSNSRKSYIQDLYLKAARMAPGQDWDPDVQVALGVLFNISSEYDKAVDCFKAALTKRPDDYILWNRLGATQAHVGRNKEATAAYFRALELHPSFIRARYNMSLASTNMGQHREAAENCLVALSLQQREMQAGGGMGKAAAGAGGARPMPASGMSATIWNALQLAMYMLGEPKLAEACERQDLDAFRAKFDF